MSFHGKETQKEEVPLRTFYYKDFGGREKKVDAHHVRFMTAHVVFLLDREGVEARVLLAESNSNVNELVEEEE